MYIQPSEHLERRDCANPLDDARVDSARVSGTGRLAEEDELRRKVDGEMSQILA